MDWSFKVGDLAIVCATLLGPVLAVQAQKWVEPSRDRNQRRITIFRVLMTTRAAILSPSHVEALNVVPIEFYGKKAAFVEVVDAWKGYIDYLYRDIADQRAWDEKRIELLNAMLGKMAAALRYKFSAVEISREFYSPKGHAAIESDQEIIRRGLARLFKGEIALPMDVKSFPADPQFILNQAELQQRLLKWLDEDGNFRITMAERPPGGIVGTQGIR